MRRIHVAAVAVTLALCIPVAASASSHRGGPAARAAAAKGAVYGGRTAQNFPVIVELTRNRRRVVQAVIGIHLDCTSGGVVNLPDRYINMTVRRRKFRASFGPDTQRNSDGSSSDFEGTISGRLNRARTKVTGTWTFKITDFDPAGAVTDVCDSGTVRWTAKQ